MAKENKREDKKDKNKDSLASIGNLISVPLNLVTFGAFPLNPFSLKGNKRALRNQSILNAHIKQTNEMNIWRSGGRVGPPPHARLLDAADSNEFNRRANFATSTQTLRDRGVVGANRNVVSEASTILGGRGITTKSKLGVSGSALGSGTKAAEKTRRVVSAQGGTVSGGSFSNGILGSKEREKRNLG